MIATMLDKIIGLLAPHVCVSCGAEGSLLCRRCQFDAIQTVPERCYRCFALSSDYAVCSKCRPNTPLRYVWVLTLYRGHAQKLLYRLKFGRGKAAASVIATLLDDMLPALPKDTILSYIPTATSRVRMRGYDQSCLIAQELAKMRGLRASRLLVRHGQTRQTGATRSQRIKQAEKHYGLVLGQNLKGKTIVLVDDISTTGATLEAAARVLKKAGAKQVNATVFAQKQ